VSFKHTMIDLETLGTSPGCVILSIGAVFFDKRLGLGDEFYTVVNTESCLAHKLHVLQSTVDWWAGQSEEAKTVLALADAKGSAPLPAALEELNKFILKGTGTRIWGNGADFDNAILSAAYYNTGVKPAWQPYNGRCYRTIKNLYPGQRMGKKRQGTHHNALDDAKSQADHLIELAIKNNFELP
jgi:DNA polymerase III epsilon subunit-like protein